MVTAYGNRVKNLFCSKKDLRNEASVETFFVDRLLKSFGYPDDKIRLKESIDYITIGKGSRTEHYRPDYILLDSSDTPKIIIDAKSPLEDPEKYLYQVSSYALHINQQYGDNPVLYSTLTNGYSFIVYPWDSNQSIFYLCFEDFVDGNESFLALKSHFAYSAFNQRSATRNVFDFQRPGLKTLIKTFYDCHKLIWKKEKIGPTDAFYQFAKIMFIKIQRDAEIHSIIDKGNNLKQDDFIFSTNWINSQIRVDPNPFDGILFRKTRELLEAAITEGTKKRIFDKDEHLDLKPSTVFEVVKKLQNYDLYGIDEDLNGRMFETFLNATVRGKELGQYFTPRGVVHYMVKTSPFSVLGNNRNLLPDRIPYILDGCCGSGGFLIDAMADLIQKISNISHLTDMEREKYMGELENNHLYGIEANPKISRICRLNMYLHGDGGSKIFQADTLDKQFLTEEGTSEEVIKGINELQRIIGEDNRKFDVVLSNPPFSMRYHSSNDGERHVLGQYKIAKNPSGNMSTSEKSNALFLERYLDLLKPGTGEILTVIDDTVLNGDNSQKYRDFILKNFIIIQVISLPFNTFFRADAAIKTSIIHLRKKAESEKQANIFMAITNNIGHDDHGRDTLERNNLLTVAKYFEEWQNGEKIQPQIISNQNTDESLACPLQIFEISANDLKPQRLDAFYYSPELKQLQKKLMDLKNEGSIDLYTGMDFEMIKKIGKRKCAELKDKVFKYIEISDVTQDGTIARHKKGYLDDLPTRARLQIQEGDIVFARHINSRGTTVLIPRWYAGNLVTTGFSGIRPKNKDEALVLWGIFESELFRKQVYYLAITASQREIRDEIFRNEILIPFPKDEKLRSKIISNARSANRSREKLKNTLNHASELINRFVE